MYEIIGRDYVGLKEPKSVTPINPSYIKGLTVHYTGESYQSIYNSITDVFGKLQSIQKFHMDSRGWSDIGYSFAVSNFSSEIIELRGFDVYSAHSGNTQINKTFASVVWLGGIQDVPNQLAKMAIERLHRIMEEKYNRKIMVTGHKDHKATACPSASMYDWINSASPAWKQPKRKTWQKTPKKFKIL